MGTSVEHQALKGGRLQSKLAGHSLAMLRKLSGSTGQLPDSYLVGEGVDYQVEDGIFACGGFADVRKGKLAKKIVAVKTIRMTQDSNMSKIRKVGTVMGVRPGSNETSNIGLLQGVCGLDAHFPPQPPKAHRSQY